VGNRLIFHAIQFAPFVVGNRRISYRIRRYLGAKLGAGETEILAWYQHWVAVALTALEETLQRRLEAAFCFGDAPGWADLHLVPQLSTARRFGCDLAPYPRLLAVEARCTELDAFRRARPEAQPDFEGEIKTVVRPV